MPLKIARTVAELRQMVQSAKSRGNRVGLVPTMGALHHGHLSLVEHISTQAETIVVSIFVNPSQFGEGEDFNAYPRNESDDLQKLENTKATIAFLPTVEEMYPDGDSTIVQVAGLTTLFEGEARPGHFAGVATVVSKLLLQCLPDVAIFGEKDYQQLAVIRRFVRDLSMPVEILGAPIIREQDGLAASSRNVYLSADDRTVAGKLNVVLRNLVQRVEAKNPITDEEESAKAALLEAGFTAVDYVAVVCAATMEPMETLNREARVIAVARIGKVRLLDNMAISPSI